MEIKSYYVGTHRQRASDSYHRRWISLVPKTPTAEVEHIVIYFFVGETIINDADIGYVTPDTTKFVVGYANISDFADMYNILQTERPVHFGWAAGGDNKLFWFQIYTDAERTGEGPKDGGMLFVLPPVIAAT
jgi:hypothetical protein